MEEFRKQIEAYSFPDSIKKTEDYLKKYWLSEQECVIKWKNIQSLIFNLRNEFPEMIINNSQFELIVRMGGLLFEQKEFELLKECINTMDDEYIIIIEDYDEQNPPHESGPLLRLKYPTRILWNEINIGDGISYELFQRPVRNYFVFGDSGKWGKYVANDHLIPVDIFCFQKDDELIFRKRFEISKNEQEELKKFLPMEYFSS